MPRNGPRLVPNKLPYLFGGPKRPDTLKHCVNDNVPARTVSRR